MKVKYYLRGLGVGIVVTAILLGRGDSGKTENLSNDEVIRRAKELGMIESTLLSESAVSDNDISELTSEEEAVSVVSGDSILTESENSAPTISGDTQVSANEIEDEVDVEVEKAQTVSDMEVLEEVELVQDAVSDNQKENATQNIATEDIVIVVNGGEGSYTVSKKLQDAGLVDDARAFDVYLSQNGYDKKITTGSHTIKPGATQEEIAKAITGR